MGNAALDMDLAAGLDNAFDLEFAEETHHGSEKTPAWNILVVDDDLDVHRVTQIVLRDFSFEGKRLHIESAYSAKEARDIISGGTSFALILLDVVMEHDEAGLELVPFIRNEIGDQWVQIVLRTGQPGIMCETNVILDYAINDYRTKTELTSRRLITTVAAGLRAYSLSQQLTGVNQQLRAANQEIESQVRERTQEFLEAKETAEYTLRKRSETLAHITHDLRSPMAGILGLSELLASGELKDEQDEVYSTITQSCKQVLELVNNILDVSKIEAGEFTITRVCHNLHQTFESVGRLMRPAATEKGLKLIIDCHADVPKNVYGDPTRMTQILQNLVGNAIKFTRVGEVRLHVQMDQNEERPTLIIHVTDTGIGISPEEKRVIFERYKQVEGAQSENCPGTGLGLFITHHLVNAMGGDMNMHSEVGKGTTFAVRLPVEVPIPNSAIIDIHSEQDRAVAIHLADTNTESMLRKKLSMWGIRTINYADRDSGSETDISNTVAVFDQATFRRVLQSSMASVINKYLGIVWVKTTDMEPNLLDHVKVPIRTLKLPLQTLAVAEACDSLLGKPHKKELSSGEISTVWPSFNLRLIVIEECLHDLQLLQIFLQKLKCKMNIVTDPLSLSTIDLPEKYHAIMISSHVLKTQPIPLDLPVIVLKGASDTEVGYSQHSPSIAGVLEKPYQPEELIPLLEHFIVNNQLSRTHTFSIH